MTCAVLVSVWLASCGGGQSRSVGTPSGSNLKGALTINIQWPTAPTRLIPANTASLLISVTGNTAGLSSSTPVTVAAGVASATFPGLLPGQYTVVVGAYPNAGGTGTLLASGADANVVITAGNTTTIGIVLDSQVVSVTAALVPSTTDDVAAHQSIATLTAWTLAGGTGSIVPISPTKVTWTSGTPSVATVPSTSANGVAVTPVTGAVTGAPALVQITGHYTELPVNLSAAATLTVTSTNPVVVSTLPADGSIGASINPTISATFDKAMNSVTVAPAFSLKQGVTAVPGTVSYAGTTATFTPATPLDAGLVYTATITTAAQDLAGDPLAQNAVWAFTTHLGAESVDLGAAGAFNILAGSAVTNADTVAQPTRINGLIGVYPSSAVSGLPTAQIPASQIHAGDPTAQAAKLALLTAYGAAVAQTKSAISLPGNLGGLTLAPGLYVNSTSSGISGSGSNAILHLDGQGDSNAVWVFKMGSTLITDPGTSIVLSGNAQAKNVFWQVGTSATLGTTSIFKGNILAAVSITLTTGADLEGRALTQAGAVTLDTNTLTLP